MEIIITSTKNNKVLTNWVSLLVRHWLSQQLQTTWFASEIPYL